MCFLHLSLFLSLSCLVDAKQCNVLDYGAKGDGKANDTDAINAAIKDCGESNDSLRILYFPSQHVFKTYPFTIDGSIDNLTSIELQHNASIINGVSSPSLWPSNYDSFIKLSNLHNFIFTGHNQGAYKLFSNFTNTSIIDGKGYPWYSASTGPHLIMLYFSTNITFKQLTLQNSPRFHLDLTPDSSNTDLYIHDLTITAPSDSPNTDAIDIAGKGAVVTNCYLATGDDNIAIKPNAYNMYIDNVYCGHGHGTSIGSIGEDGSTGYVENITFNNIYYDGTVNVARIKTWQGGKGKVSDVSYIGMEFENVDYPLLIDQYYCPSSQHPKPCVNETDAVEIKDVLFENFYGTHMDGFCGEFECSDSIPCDNIVLKNITIKSGNNGKNEWKCWQVEDGKASDVSPQIKSQGNCQW